MNEQDRRATGLRLRTRTMQSVLLRCLAVAICAVAMPLSIVVGIPFVCAHPVGCVLGAAIASVALHLATRNRTPEALQRARDEEAVRMYHALEQGERPKFALYLRPFRGMEDVIWVDEDAESSPADVNSSWPFTLERMMFGAVSPHVPLVALGEKTTLDSSGKITFQGFWQSGFITLARHADPIVIVPLGKGARIELAFLASSDLLRNTVFLMPPVVRRFDRYSDAVPATAGQLPEEPGELQRLEDAIRRVSSPRDLEKALLALPETPNEILEARAWRLHQSTGLVKWTPFAAREWARSAEWAARFGLVFPPLDAAGCFFAFSADRSRVMQRPLLDERESANWRSIQECLVFARTG